MQARNGGLAITDLFQVSFIDYGLPILVLVPRIERRFSAHQADVLLLNYTSKIICTSLPIPVGHHVVDMSRSRTYIDEMQKMVGESGFEPP